MSNSKTVEYKEELFNIIHDLSLINNSIIFLKSEEKDKVLVKRRDIEQSLVYILEAPIDYFNFPTDDVSFYSYNDFYQYFKAFEKPEIKIDDSKIYILEDNSKVDYILSNKESIAKEGSVNNVKFGNADIKFSLTANDLDELVKMSSLLKAQRAKLTVKDDSVSIRLFNNRHDNSFEKIFKIEKLTDFSGTIDFVIFSDAFNKIPQKKNYTIEIKKEGYIKIHLDNENINLSIYTGSVKN